MSYVEMEIGKRTGRSRSRKYHTTYHSSKQSRAGSRSGGWAGVLPHIGAALGLRQSWGRDGHEYALIRRPRPRRHGSSDGSTRVSSTWASSTRRSKSSKTTSSQASQNGEWEGPPQLQIPLQNMSHPPRGNQHPQGDTYAAILSPQSRPRTPFPPLSPYMQTPQTLGSNYGLFHALEPREQREPTVDNDYAPASFPTPRPSTAYRPFPPPYGQSTQTYNIPRNPPSLETAFSSLRVSDPPTPYRGQQSRQYGAYPQSPYRNRSSERTLWASGPRYVEAGYWRQRPPIVHGERPGLGHDNNSAQGDPGDYPWPSAWRYSPPQRPRERSRERVSSSWTNKFSYPRSNYNAGSTVRTDPVSDTLEPKPPATYKNLPRRRAVRTPSPPPSPERTPPSLIIVDPPAPRTSRGRATSRGTSSSAAASRGDSPAFVYGGGSMASGSRIGTFTETSLGWDGAARPRSAKIPAPVVAEGGGGMRYPDWRDPTAAQSTQTRGMTGVGHGVVPLAGGVNGGGGVYIPVLTPVMW